MRKTFETILSVGALILLYTGVTSGLSALFDGGLFWMLNMVFNPFIFGPFWFVVTLIQDVCLIVGGIGVLVTKKPQVNEFEEHGVPADVEQAVNEVLSETQPTVEVAASNEQVENNSKLFEN
ncbi:hypothetical protein RZE82_03895 [Mollicutes bacterium LVI A0039]|nr:hypothetical protein RZE82_03895 [Mollicutes bacterium LVI A0039]